MMKFTLLSTRHVKMGRLEGSVLITFTSSAPTGYSYTQRFHMLQKGVHSTV